MPPPIPETTKSKVIDMWLQGFSREANAKTNDISTGTVSNVVKEWQDKIGRDLAQGLRVLYGSLDREDLTVAECAIGFRSMKIFSEQGVDAETAEHFISDLYKDCNSRGITPKLIAIHIENLIRFSDNMTLAEIEAYVNTKIAQNKGLDDQNKELVDKKEKLNHSIISLEAKNSELKKTHDLILAQNKEDEEEMISFLIYKLELEKYGISITNDIPKFASTVKTIAEYRYDSQKVVDEFFDIQHYQDKLRALKIAIDEEEKCHKRLESQNSSLLKKISFHSSKADLYNELDVAGFGVAELRRLLDTLTSISISNQMDQRVSTHKFFSDLDQYDAKLGFESAKNKISTEIKRLDAEREKKLENLRNQPFIGPVIGGLLKLGLNDTDIIENTKILYNILKSSSIKDIALSTVEAVEEMATNHKRTTTIDDEVIEILGRAKEELSRLDL